LKKRIAIAILVLVVAIIAPPAVHLLRVAHADARRDLAMKPPTGFADDASHLNQTRVAKIIDVSPDDNLALAQIRDALRSGLPVSIAGFRHSMGGQTIAANGIVLNMLPHDHLRYDAKTKHLVAGSGATWDLVIPYIDRFGRAVAVMQSDSPFSVGGSLSVNCHGWQPLEPPIESTIIAVDVVTADGALHHCSRTQDADLFSHILGGYGLFGVILDAELTTVPNELYQPRAFHMTIDDYEKTFAREVEQHRDIGLAYGRIGVAQHHLAGDAMLTTYQRTKEEPPPLEWYEPPRLERWLFRGSLRSAYGKWLRWWSERHLAPVLHGGMITRNELMDGDINQYINRWKDERDILHEYFIPRGDLAPFLHDVDRVIRANDAELLNITIRDVRSDDTTSLAYARRDVFAAVMFFEQRATTDGEARMEKLTRALIDVALEHGGTYYLPYRLHATPQQFRAAYPQCDAFFAAKRRADPNGVFRNAWFDRYVSAASDRTARPTASPAYNPAGR